MTRLTDVLCFTGRTFTLVLTIFLIFGSDRGFAQNESNPQFFDNLTSLGHDLVKNDPYRAGQCLNLLESFSDQLGPLEMAKANYLRLMILRGKNADFEQIRGRLIRAEYDEVDILSNLSVAEKEIEYVSQYSLDENTLPDLSRPDQHLLQRLPFGSFVLNFGLVYSF